MTTTTLTLTREQLDTIYGWYDLISDMPSGDLLDEPDYEVAAVIREARNKLLKKS